MTTTHIAEVLGIDAWPEVYDAVFERFNTAWPQVKKEPILDIEALNALVEEGFISKDGVPDMLACLACIQADEELHFAFMLMFYALCVYRGPHENEFYAEPVPPTLGKYDRTFMLLLLTKILIKGIGDARRRGIPEECLNEHRGAADGGPLGDEGIYGVPSMFHWRAVCSFATMYQAGAFRYEPERVPEGYRMLRRKADGKLLMLYTAERRFDEFGQFASADDQVVFTSCAAKGETDGYLIAPDGRVLNRYVELPADEWELAFDSGDTALSFHIPSDIPYNFEAAADSFEKGVAFFAKYFPDLKVRSVQSYSWLYSPQLKDMLPETSGINRLNRDLYLAPVPSGADGFYCFVFKTDAGSFDVNTVEADTSLKRGFVSFVKNGGRVHNGFMYLPAADTASFAEQGAALYAIDMFDKESE